MNEERIKYAVIEIVSEKVNLSKCVQLSTKSMVREELGINSISLMEIIVCIESEFNIEFNEDELSFEKYTDIESIISVVINHISNNK